jgi:hypothetical protein
VIRDLGSAILHVCRRQDFGMIQELAQTSVIERFKID